MKKNTKQIISESLLRLLETKPLAKITINDLAEDCGVSRMTFYYHFRDIYDLVEWTIACEAEKASAECRGTGGWEGELMSIMNVLKNRESLVLNVYHSTNQGQLERYLFRGLQTLLRIVTEKAAEELDLGMEEKRRVADFYAYAFWGIIFAWIDRGMKDPPETIIPPAVTIFCGGLIHSLEAVSTDRQRTAYGPESGTAKELLRKTPSRGKGSQE